MIKLIYIRTIDIFKRVPVKLWGISLLSGLLSILVVLFGGLPIITIPAAAGLSAGMAAVYYKVYTGGEANSKTMLSAFSDLKTFRHVAGGLCWMYLWIILWFLIPIAGPFIAIYKGISYSFTPYILNEEKSVSGLEAIKKSMRDTQGIKANIFAAVIIPAAAYWIVSIILSLLGLIPFVGVIFRIISFIVSLAYAILAPMFFGLVKAGFYDYGKKPASNGTVQAAPVIPAVNAEAAKADTAEAAAPSEKAVNPAENICSVCGNSNSPETKFCMKCGAKL